MEGFIKQILVWFKRALFPQRCVVCGLFDTWLCATCFIKTKFITRLTCPTCGLTSTTGNFCAVHKKIYLNGLWYALPYGNKAARDLIHIFKYDGVIEIKTVLTDFILIIMNALNLPPAWHSVAKTNWQLVPVPLHPQRLRYRGFNQALLLAEAISNKTALKVNDLLKKHKLTKPQAKLANNKRRQNINRSFALKQDQDLTGQIFILIDDVYTSGATLNNCARVLKNHGATEVWALTVAKG